MGLLDGLAGQLLGQISGAGAGGGQYAALVPAVLELLRGESGSGGLASLIQNFNNNGLGDVMSSWIGTGQNLPISANQLQDVLGGDLLQQLAGKTGMAQGDLANQLSGLLPQVVDKLTPDGQLPAGGDIVSAALKGFGGKLFG
jgi:uncharacterized protein YidB (DUF937 family)